jgi:hypothetical protein
MVFSANGCMVWLGSQRDKYLESAMAISFFTSNQFVILTSHSELAAVDTVPLSDYICV